MTPGDRPAGVMTAGTAQKFVNIKGFMPGKRIVKTCIRDSLQTVRAINDVVNEDLSNW